METKAKGRGSEAAQKRTTKAAPGGSGKAIPDGSKRRPSGGSSAASARGARTTPADEVEALIPASGKAVEIEVDGRTVKLSNLDKVLYPEGGVTKADVIRYYARIAPVLLPQLHDHPVTLKRYPDGIEGKAFFEKNANRYRPDWVRTTPVPHTRKEGTIDYVLVQDLPTLLWAANLASIELHPSLSVGNRRAKGGISGPRSLVFDLDPGPGTSIVECCRVGLTIRDLLGELGLELVAKTSGSKGLQLYAPLNSGATYERTTPFAKAVATLLEQRDPDHVVSRMTKTLREGKVLIDWSQNNPHKTTVGVYSLRAREQPTVSTPVTWDEVQECEASGDPDRLVFLRDDVLERVDRDGDLFAPLLETEQELPELDA